MNICFDPIVFPIVLGNFGAGEYLMSYYTEVIIDMTRRVTRNICRRIIEILFIFIYAHCTLILLW